MNIASIKLATREYAAPISELINSVSNYFTLDPQGLGAEGFLETISTESILKYIENPSFYYCICLIEKELAGVIAIKEKTHVFHLFVSPEHQKKGLARLLWNHALVNVFELNAVNVVTVNSTPFAVEVYKKFGFKCTGEKIEKNGSAFVPMKLEKI
jgi:GNAT superfamily N-acetyltransferase